MRKKIHLHHEKIGTKRFEGVLDVTDPCYNKDVWCRIKTPSPVKRGDYECAVWRGTTVEIYDGKPYRDTRVWILGIYLDGIIPKQKKFEEIGEIGVDAGLAGFFMDKPDYDDEAWSEFCNSIREGDAWIKPEGFFRSSGLGDGCYPVYAHRNESGYITALEIRFG